MSVTIILLPVGGQYAASSFYGVDENSFKLMERETGGSARKTHVMPVQTLRACGN